ncbi:energy-coupling factor ABC transporter permease [Corynebacterium mendelii]|uniref:Cobalt transport protein CbiM n=1 Tax=Corynebacterium mendelii TaxID=2765362 RepID=A0A939E121_9CORY|nr:energy-coupling factor ABC transporter permease [Corynebacterium mendelii]MBN9645010.1 energy-coupling factor ABC transporter permease [Corynebacterium mendelii]
MHIAEGFLPVTHCIAWGAVSAPFVIHGAMAVRKSIRNNPESTLLLGAAGAFSFVLSALKIPSVTGSCSHPTGTGLGAVLFKPPVMAFMGSIVLVFQALLLAHGGITTLGANIFSMAIAGPWVGWMCWLAVRKAGGSHSAAIFCAAFFSDLVTYIVAAFELALAHHASGFGTAFATFLGLYAPTQVPLAIVESIVTVLIFRALVQVAPKELAGLGVLGGSKDPAGTPRAQVNA